MKLLLRKRGTRNAILAYALFILLATVLAYCSWGVSLFIHHPIVVQESWIEPVEYWPAFVLGVLAFGGFICVRGLPANMKQARIALLVAGAWMLLAIIRVTTVPVSGHYEMEKPWALADGLPPFYSFDDYEFPVAKAWMDIGTEYIFVLFLGLVFLYFADMTGVKFLQMTVCWLFVILGLVSALYTFLPGQIGQYKTIIDHIVWGVHGEYQPIISFYWQKNVYGFFLFTGILATMVINEKKPFWLCWPLLLFFTIMNVFAICKTVILISAILLPVYFILCLGRSYKQHIPRNSTILGLVVALGLAVAVTVYVYRDSDLIRRLVKIIGREIGSGGTTLSWRTQHWLIAWGVNNISFFRILFGYGFIAGEEISMRYQEVWMPSDVQRTSHSIFVDIYLRYGAIGLYAELLLICYMVYLLWKLWKKERWKMAPGLALVIISAFVYSLDESKGFFYRDTNSLAFLAICYLPVAVYTQGYKVETVLSKLKLNADKSLRAPLYLSYLSYR